ncbi:hypothetical protein D6764_02865 [Candidatus Woesearchaeota archaeon]|nr:MAG: hypothetical protein D6764_02865 [Candidatus Woesearchaeota archaeon]
MKREGMMIFAVLAVLVLVSGCGSGNSSTTSSDKTPFVGGTEGLSIDFMDGAPPPEVYDGGNYPFEVALRVQNKGEHDVPANEVTVELTGIDPADFSVSPADLVKHPDEDLLGTMKDSDGNIIDGTITYINFPNFNYAGQLSGNMIFTLRADACYTYETVANTKLCIIEDVLDFDAETVCKVNEKKTVFNSGAPVQVTSFEQSPMGQNRISFTFEVSHAGLGKIYGEGTNCDSTVTNEDKVYVEVDTGIEGHPADCPGLGGGPSGTITLYGGKRTIRCNQDVSGATTNYEKVITIRLRYDYEQTASKTLLVKHAS